MSESKAPEAQVTQQPPPIDERIDAVLEALNSGRSAELPAMMALWSSGEAAAVLEALPLPARQQLLEKVPEARLGEVLARMGEQARSSLLEGLQVEEAVAATAQMETAALAEVVDEASKELKKAILESLAPDARALVDETLVYPEDSAGRLMTREWVAIRADVSLELVKRYLLA